jgi:hypothetical protein
MVRLLQMQPSRKAKSLTKCFSSLHNIQRSRRTVSCDVMALINLVTMKVMEPLRDFFSQRRRGASEIQDRHGASEIQEMLEQLADETSKQPKYSAAEFRALFVESVLDPRVEEAARKRRPPTIWPSP